MKKTLSSKILENSGESLSRRIKDLEVLIKITDEIVILALIKGQIHYLIEKDPGNARTKNLLSLLKKKLKGAL